MEIRANSKAVKVRHERLEFQIAKKAKKGTYTITVTVEKSQTLQEQLQRRLK